MSAEQTPLSVGDVVADKYRVDGVLGSGGMSLVVLAWHLELEQEVAIKVLHGRHIEGSEAIQRFRREARAAARIRSEHVARVLDVGALENGSPFIVMEYLHGNDLDAELTLRGPLPVEEAVVYVMQSIDAIAEAHAAGIVHRDLKPENLFLAERADGSRVLKVLDFGVSKSMALSSVGELSLTKTASFVGSPLYMSPEQVHSPRSVDPRSDVWSLGAILYQTLSGVAPFSGESLAEVCTRIVNDVPVPISERRPGLPPGFETVVLRCLEKDRNRRYATVAELAYALAPFAAGAGVYAERAERVLSGTATLPGSPATLQSLSLSWNPARSPSALRRSQAGAAPSEPPHARPSTAGWWMRSVAPEGARRRAPFVIALAMTLAVGFGASELLVRRGTNTAAGSEATSGVRQLPDETPSTKPISSELATAEAARSERPAQPAVSDAAGPASSTARVRAPARRRYPPAPTAAAAPPSSSALATRRQPPEQRSIDAWDSTTFGGRH